MPVKPQLEFELCLSCKFAQINEKKKGTNKYIHCLQPRIHPQFNVTYYVDLRRPLISCKFYKQKR